jgi:hypothetical protein
MIPNDGGNESGTITIIIIIMYESCFSPQKGKNYVRVCYLMGYQMTPKVSLHLLPRVNSCRRFCYILCLTFCDLMMIGEM